LSILSFGCLSVYAAKKIEGFDNETIKEIDDDEPHQCFFIFVVSAISIGSMVW
jgi:hypothetical protein